MAKGIGLAGGFGAAGAAAGLRDVLAERMAQAQFAEEKRAQAAAEAQRMAAAQLDREQFGYTRERDAADRASRAEELKTSREESGRRFGIEQSVEDAASQERQFEREQRRKETAEQREQRLKERQEDRALDAGERAKDRSLQRELATLRSSGSGSRPLPASLADEMATMETAQQMGRELVELGDKVEWKGVGGLKAGTLSSMMAKNFGRGTPEQQSLRNHIGNIKGTIVKLKAGTAMTPQEQALLETYTPTIDDDPMVIRQKITDLNKFIDTKRAITLRIYGAGDAPGGGSGVVVNDPRTGGSSPGAPTSAGPAVGTIRMIGGQRAQWDGKGWLPAQE